MFHPTRAIEPGSTSLPNLLRLAVLGCGIGLVVAFFCLGVCELTGLELAPGIIGGVSGAVAATVAISILRGEPAE